MSKSPDIYFEVISALNKKIRTTKEHWNRIIETKHRVMKEKEELVKETLQNAEQIRKSRKDLNVYLYYRNIGNKKYNCVVCKHLNGEGFIITAYITDRIKAGEEYETY